MKGWSGGGPIQTKNGSHLEGANSTHPSLIPIPNHLLRPGAETEEPPEWQRSRIRKLVRIRDGENAISYFAYIMPSVASNDTKRLERSQSWPSKRSPSGSNTILRRRDPGEFLK